MKKLLFLLFLLPSISLAGDVVIRQGSGGGTLSIVSSTATGSGNSILNQNTLQSGSTFFVSSGSVQGNLTVNTRINSLSLFTNGVYQTSGSGTFYGLDGAPTLYVNDEESGIGVDPFFTQNITLYAGLSPILTVENGAAALQNTSFLKLMDGDNSNYVGLRSSNTVTTNNIYTLPSSSGAANTALVLDGRNNYEHKGIILNQNSLQDGASFYVRTGVIQNGGLGFALDGVPSTITVRATSISAARTINLPNASGTFAVSATSPISLSATGAISITSPLPIANGGTNNVLGYNDNAIVISNGTSLTHDVTGLNYESATDSLGVGATATSAAFIQTGPGSTTMAPINLGKGSTRTSPADGDIWFTTDTNSFNTYSTDIVSPYMSVVNVSTADTNGQALSSEITLSSNTLGTKTFPVNGETRGKLIRIEGWGYLSTDAAVTPDLRFRIYVGTTVVGDANFTTLSNSQTNIQWNCYLVSTVRKTSTTGTVMSQGRCTVFDGGSDRVVPIVNTAAFNINFSSTKDIKLTGQFSTADAGNSITATNFWWEYGY